MIHTVLGLIINIFLFFIIGFWPTFWLSSKKDRILSALAMAPVTGFAITSIVATYLILLDYPVKTWSGIYTFVCTTGSVGIFAYYIIKRRHELNVGILKRKDIGWLISGGVITIIVVLLPALLGGVEFTTLRGNGGDTFNYITLAKYLDQEAYSWGGEASISELIEKDRSYPWAVSFLSSRWTTSAMLAYTSRIATVPIYQFEYLYTILFFIIAYGPGYLLGRRLKLSRGFSFSVALMICVGFWAQFVLDTRAFSEINSIPIILCVGYFIIEIFSRTESHFYRRAVILGVFAVSLVFLYIEILPLCLLSASFFLILMFVKSRLKFKIDLLAPLGIGFAVFVFGSAPLYIVLVKFINKQLNLAAGTSNDWHTYYFSWLYGNPLVGFWGLEPLNIFSTIPSMLWAGKIVQLLLVTMGGWLFFIFLISIFYMFVRKSSNTSLLFVVSFVCATLVETFFLLIKNQLWAAGKSLAFGYPFILLFVAGVGLRADWYFASSLMRRAVRLTLMLWVAIQLSIGLARSAVAFTGVEFPNYIVHHGEYKSHNYDVTSIDAYLRDKHQSIIWMIIPNVWPAEYLNLVLEGNHHVVDVLALPSRQIDVAGYRQSMINAPDYLLTTRNSLDYNKRWVKYVVAENSDFVLLKTSQSKLLYLLIMNSYGAEDWNGRIGFWMGTDQTVLNIISSENEKIVFMADFVPGPSIPGQEQRTLEIIDNESGKMQVYNINRGGEEFVFTVRRGENKIILDAVDLSVIPILPNGDQRTLLLGITNINIQFLR